MRNRRVSSRTLASVAALSLIALIGLSACGRPQQGASATMSTGEDTARQPVPAASASTSSEAGSPAALGNTGNVGTAQRGSAEQADLLTGASVIKTGSVALRSDRIGHVLVRVYGIVGGVGGDVSSENTSTDAKGRAVRSMLALQVPVEDFDSTLNELSRLGTLVDRARSAKDVTTEVADIGSRVNSAQRSITTLRRLFDRARRLGDVIRLESELSQREANLESLQAQQRALHDKTSMSTITMTIERLPASVTKTTNDSHKVGGFLTGIHQGWHALSRTTLAIGQGLGVVLPLGTVALLLGALGLWFVRRFAPRPAPATKPTVET
jgi:hypothetical protein